MTPEQLVAAIGASPKIAAQVIGPLTAAMKKYAIDRPLRIAHFVAQCAHESMIFTAWEENLRYHGPQIAKTWPTRFYLPPDRAECTLKSGSIVIRKVATIFEMRPDALANEVYGGRMGNAQPGDGWRFRGRGPLGLTGRDNYTGFNRAEPTYPCISSPDVISTTEAGCFSAAWHWATHGCNPVADQDNVAAVTAGVNGGVIGLADRIALTNRAKTALGA